VRRVVEDRDVLAFRQPSALYGDGVADQMVSPNAELMS